MMADTKNDDAPVAAYITHEQAERLVSKMLRRFGEAAHDEVERSPFVDKDAPSLRGYRAALATLPAPAAPEPERWRSNGTIETCPRCGQQWAFNVTPPRCQQASTGMRCIPSAKPAYTQPGERTYGGIRICQRCHGPVRKCICEAEPVEALTVAWLLTLVTGNGITVSGDVADHYGECAKPLVPRSDYDAMRNYARQEHERAERHGRERDETFDKYVTLVDANADLTRERDELRAQLDAMEKQEPVTWRLDHGSSRYPRYTYAENRLALGVAAGVEPEPLYAAPVPAPDAAAIRDAALVELDDALADDDWKPHSAPRTRIAALRARVTP